MLSTIGIDFTMPPLNVAKDPKGVRLRHAG